MGESDALIKTMASVTDINELLDGFDESNAENGASEDALNAASGTRANAEGEAVASDAAGGKDATRPGAQDAGNGAVLAHSDAPDTVRIVTCDDAAGSGVGTQGGNGAQRGDRALDGSGNPNADAETYLFTREMLESPNGWSHALTPERVAMQAELDANLRNPVLENGDLVEFIAEKARVLQ